MQRRSPGAMSKKHQKYKWHMTLKLAGQELDDRPKMTEPNLQFPAVSCDFLRKSAVFCENLWFSVVSCALHMLKISGETVNLRKSAAFCENLRFGFSLSP